MRWRRLRTSEHLIVRTKLPEERADSQAEGPTTTDWTDHRDNDPGNPLLQLLAYLGEHLDPSRWRRRR